MSHEIRTPLNAVLGMDELIISEVGENKPVEPAAAARIREYADNIKDAGQILLSVINDILDLTKVESGKMEINAAPYKLHELTDDIDTLIRIKAEQKENANHKADRRRNKCPFAHRFFFLVNGRD